MLRHILRRLRRSFHRDLAHTGAALAALATVLLGAHPVRAGTTCTPVITGGVSVGTSLTVGSGGVGSYAIDGAGCSEAYGSAIVGFNGVGDLTLTNGASMAITSTFRTAMFVNGTSTIASGSQVTAGDCQVSYRDGDTGSNAGGIGSLTVTGSGTSLACSDELWLAVDNDGTLEVSDGAQVTAGRMPSLGFEFGTLGTLLVNSGASVEITGSNGATHIFGVRGSSLVEIDGGTLSFSNAGSGIITACSVGACAAEVTVANGGLLSAQFVFLDGASLVTLDGGTIESQQNVVQISENTVLRGNGTILGDFDVRADVEPGIDGIGHVDVVGDDATDGNLFGVGGGKLVFEIESAQSFDTIDVAGDLDWDRNVRVDFINAFEPTLGSSFEVITVGGQIVDWNPFVSITGLSPALMAETTIAQQGNSIVVQVPEPGSLASGLAALSCIGGAAFRRRRARAAHSG